MYLPPPNRSRATITPHHITSHHITYYTTDHTASHHTTPHHTTPHRTAPHRTALHHTTPHLTTPHHTAPHRTTLHTPHHTVHHSFPNTTPHQGIARGKICFSIVSLHNSQCVVMFLHISICYKAAQNITTKNGHSCVAPSPAWRGAPGRHSPVFTDDSGAGSRWGHWQPLGAPSISTQYARGTSPPNEPLSSPSLCLGTV